MLTVTEAVVRSIVLLDDNIHVLVDYPSIAGKMSLSKSNH